MTDARPYPLIRPVADRAIMVEFGDVISDDAQQQVASLDTKLGGAPFYGFTEAVPALVNILVCFDPTLSDHASAEQAVKALLASPDLAAPKGCLRLVEICYDDDFAPDLKEVSNQTGLTEDAIVNQHLATTYRVVMYGFAPGYAYLGGGPSALYLPRKPSAKRGVPAASVIIAGSQCLITTLTMPTGWWIIGRSTAKILTDDPAKPFLFNLGDEIRFRRIDRSTFDLSRATG